METKLNIAEILKDKPVNTKLYSPTYGDCNLIVPEDMIITDMLGENRCFYEDGKISKTGECMLFPSKEMRDWSKFAWKKGDVLVSKGRRTLHVIIEGFNDDTYTTFKGKHYLCDYSDKEDYDEEYYNDYHKEVNERTIEFEKDNVNNAQTYINIIEKRLGGKLNRETLEIEKTQPEFKDGDILYATDWISGYIYINKEPKSNIDICYCYKLSGGGYLHICNLVNPYDCTLPSIAIKEKETRFATESEKQQLFDALAKKGKAWDAEKKEVIDLKPRVELKPFDKVLVRDNKSDYWRASLFSHIDKNGNHYCIWANWHYCIPYEGNEHLLGTTKDVED